MTQAVCVYFNQTHVELKVGRSRTKGNEQIYLYFSKYERRLKSGNDRSTKVQIMKTMKGFTLNSHGDNMMVNALRK